MSALPIGAQDAQEFTVRAMTRDDLAIVSAIEIAAYPHPWSRAHFADSLIAGYDAWIFERRDEVIGYAVVMWAIDEVHLLNLCVAVPHQGQGMGRRLLRWLTGDAAARGARGIMLEVRPSNLSALALYRADGFHEIGLRRGYYPAGSLREDAVVLFRKLGDG